MNKYLIYTVEGRCEDPNENVVFNCQVLGRSYGEYPQDAIERLFASEKWISEHGFRKEECVVAQLHDSELIF